jgi:hypothetical protein
VTNTKTDAETRFRDDDGMVGGGAMHHGTDYPCVGRTYGRNENR